MLRLARREDVRAIMAIYAPYVRETAVTFEYEMPSYEAFVRRFEGISAGYPWLVWEEAGEILGYAYADRAFERAAFAWDADMSVYLREDARGRGIGGRLYDCLEQMLGQRGYHNLYALITGENLSSVRFHERRGYERLGVLRATGFKFGRWHDLYWYGLRLREAGDPGAMPEPFSCTREDAALMERLSR